MRPDPDRGGREVSDERDRRHDLDVGVLRVEERLDEGGGAARDRDQRGAARPWIGVAGGEDQISAGGLRGGGKSPPPLILPALAFQVTDVSEAPVTVAVNCWVPPAATVAVGGCTVTTT